ncbi:MAG: amidase domain-containing protein [Christensenellales bacterium]|jgi:hypothetical protein
MKTLSYNRAAAVAYANKWALDRNPGYYNYERLGGDCTNFASQCLYSGAGVMNYLPDKGWYYINGNNKSPSWTGVEFFYNFITNNISAGPFGEECGIGEVAAGDFIQLGNNRGYYHTLTVVRIQGAPSENSIYIATHTFDSLNRVLSSYSYMKSRFIKILGVRTF